MLSWSPKPRPRSEQRAVGGVGEDGAHVAGVGNVRQCSRQLRGPACHERLAKLVGRGAHPIGHLVGAGALENKIRGERRTEGRYHETDTHRQQHDGEEARREAIATPCH